MCVGRWNLADSGPSGKWWMQLLPTSVCIHFWDYCIHQSTHSFTFIKRQVHRHLRTWWFNVRPFFRISLQGHAYKTLVWLQFGSEEKAMVYLQVVGWYKVHSQSTDAILRNGYSPKLASKVARRHLYFLESINCFQQFTRRTRYCKTFLLYIFCLFL